MLRMGPARPFRVRGRGREAVDGVPERAWLHVVRELALVLKNAISFDPAKHGLDPIAGNHVIVRTSALFAHPRRERSP